MLCALPLYLFFYSSCHSSLFLLLQFATPLLIISLNISSPAYFTEGFLSQFGQGCRHFLIHNLNAWDHYQPPFNQTLTETWCGAELDKLAHSYTSVVHSSCMYSDALQLPPFVLCCSAVLIIRGKKGASGGREVKMCERAALLSS